MFRFGMSAEVFLKWALLIIFLLVMLFIVTGLGDKLFGG